MQGRGRARLVVSAALGIFLAQACTGAHAQAPPDFEDVEVPSYGRGGAIDQVGPRFHGLVMPSPPENVTLLWGLRRSLAERGNGEAAAEKLPALDGLRRDLGWPGLPLVSAALSVEACAAHASPGAAARAADSATWATTLSPLQPEPHWTALNIALGQGVRPAAALRHLIAWVRLSLDDRLQRRRLAAELLLLVYVAALGSALCVLAVSFLRHLRLLAHTLSHVLPRGSSERQRTLATVILLLAVPVLVPAGVLGLLAGWALLLWRYLSLPERAAALAAVLLVSAAPVAVRPLDRQISETGSVRAAAYRVQHRGAYPGDVARLRDALRVQGDNALVRFTLALDAKRAGRTYDAVKLLQPLVAAQGAPRQARALSAVLDLAQQRPSAARSTLEALVKGVRPSFSAQYNLFRIAQAQGTPNVTELMAAAQAADPERADALLADDHPGINRLLAEERTDPDAILPGLWDAPRGSSRFLPVIRPLLLGVLAPASAAVVGGGVIFALVILGLIGGRWPRVHACARCGQPLCPRCHTLVGRTRHCEGCTPGFLLLDGPTLLSSAVIDERRRRARLSRRQWAIGLNLLLPGAGLVLHGATGPGAALLAGWWLVVLRLATFGGVFRPLLPWGHIPDYATAGLLIVFGGAVWVVAQVLLRWTPDDRWT